MSKTACWQRNINGKICGKRGVVKVTEKIAGTVASTVDFYCEDHKGLAKRWTYCNSCTRPETVCICVKTAR